MTDITLVTGLWDINRSELSQGWNRSFEEHYIKKFTELLKVPYNLIVFGEKELESVVFKHRNPENTQFIDKHVAIHSNIVVWRGSYIKTG